MAHIELEAGVPGIRSLALFRPETARPLYALAEVLLRGPSPLSPAERELISAYVSSRNHCHFCMSSHAAAARCLYGEHAGTVDAVLNDLSQAPITEKLEALLHIAGKVQVLGKQVMPYDINRAREAGADDREIHDTVLIAATFSMFNRYVDGLATLTPAEPELYAAMGQRLAEQGYNPPKKD